MPNRVAGGFSPPAPTTPRMRVRTGRFLRGRKRIDNHDPLQSLGTSRSPVRLHLVRCSAPLRSRRPVFVEGSGLHHVSPITVSVGLLRRLLTSVRSRRVSPRAAPCGGRRTVGSGGASSAFALGLSPAPVARDRELRVRWRFRAFRRGPQSDSPLRSTLPFGQISPNKNMNLPCAIAAFTLSTAPGRLHHLVLTRPQTGPSMRFLSVDSQVCARASSGRVLAGAPLPSARGNAFHHRKVRNSHRGLSPHQFMPMSGVHPPFNPTAASVPLAVPSSLRSSAAG